MRNYFKLSDLRNGAKFIFVDDVRYPSCPCVKRTYDYKSRMTSVVVSPLVGDSFELAVACDPFVEPVSDYD